MGITAVIVKIMPESPDSDLKALEEKAKRTLEIHGAQNVSFEEKPVAFGLKAVMAKFAWPEEKPTDLIEEILGKVDEVSAVDIVDYRRAFG